MAETTEYRISGIVLAAGQARRIGRTKQLMAFRHTTILGQVIENARNSKLHEIIVVLGHDADNIRRRLDFEGINPVVNNDYPLGQSTSIKAGLEHLSCLSDGAMFLLGDQPLVDEHVIDSLIEGFGHSHKHIVIPVSGGKRGNPVIIGRQLFEELAAAIHGDAGARVLFNRHEHEIHFVELDKRCIHVDVDTMEDYHTLLAIDRDRETHINTLHRGEAR